MAMMDCFKERGEGPTRGQIPPSTLNNRSLLISYLLYTSNLGTWRLSVIQIAKRIKFMKMTVLRRSCDEFSHLLVGHRGLSAAEIPN